MLDFTRYYNSFENALGLHPTLMGVNWRSTYDRYLTVNGSTATLERPDGRAISFTSNGSAWTAQSDADYTLTPPASGNNWTVTCPDDTTETYVIGGSGYNGLTQIKARDGYLQTIQTSGTQMTGVSDTYGRALTFTLDTAGHITAVTTPESYSGSPVQMNFAYGGSGTTELLSTAGYGTTATPSQATQIYAYSNSSFPYALTSITDEDSNAYAAWSYDGTGRVNTSQHAGGADLHTFTYGTGTAMVTGPLSQLETYTFTTLQNVPKLSRVDRAASSTVPQASFRTQGYDSMGYVNTRTDWNGNTTNLTNNGHGLPTQIVEAYNSSPDVHRTTTINYSDPNWSRLRSSIVTAGLTTSYTYESTTGNVDTVQLQDTTANPQPTRTWTNQYQTTTTPGGSIQTLQWSKTPLGNQTNYTYNSTGLVSATTDPLGHAAKTTVYSGGGLPLTLQDANNVVTTMTYDYRQRMLTSTVATAAGNATTTYTYDLAGNLTNKQLPDTSYLTYAYDAAHRLTSVTDAVGNSQNYTLDAMGDVTANIWKLGTSTKRQQSATFDSLGRMLTSVAGTNRTTTYAYDNNGNATSIIDPNGKTTAQFFDALNRLYKVTDRLNNSTTTSYDAHDRPLSVATPNGATTSYVYDGYGEVTQETSPDRGITVYTYDLDGNQATKKDAANVTATSAYDADDRRTAVTYSSGTTLNAHYNYDEAGHPFGIGRLTSMSDQTGTFSRSYDERGNVTAESHTHTVSGNPVTMSNAYSYNAASRLASITYPSGAVITQSFDAAGQVSGITVKPTPAGTAQTVVRSVKHYPFGPFNSVTFGNGDTSTRTYDAGYRTTGVYDSNTGTNLVQLSYGYDSNGNATSIGDAVTTTNNQTLTYDAMDRILTASGAYGSETLTYDANGNRASFNGTTWAYRANTNILTGIGGQTITPDADGRVTGISGSPSTSIHYNSASGINYVNLGSSTILSYKFDGFGRRIEKTDTNVRLEQYGFDNSWLEDATGDLTVRRDYIYLDGIPVATFISNTGTGTLSFLHTDKNGTPVFADDANHAQGWSFANGDPFGSGGPNNTSPSVGSIANDIRFPGQEAESALAINYNGARDYVPSWGRYLQTDPIGLAGGQNSTYAYAASNPQRFVDADGLDPFGPFGTGPMNPYLQQAGNAGGPVSIDPARASQLLQAASLGLGTLSVINVAAGDLPGAAFFGVAAGITNIAANLLQPTPSGSASLIFDGLATIGDVGEVATLSSIGGQAAQYMGKLMNQQVQQQDSTSNDCQNQ